MCPIETLDRKSTRLNSSHTVIYTLSLHDALPIYLLRSRWLPGSRAGGQKITRILHHFHPDLNVSDRDARSEEHTSELQSHSDLHSFPTRRSSDLSAPESLAAGLPRRRAENHPDPSSLSSGPECVRSRR